MAAVADGLDHHHRKTRLRETLFCKCHKLPGYSAPLMAGIARNDHDFPHSVLGMAAQAKDAANRNKSASSRKQAQQKLSRHASNAARNRKDSAPVILLSPACASFDQYKDFEARGDAFRQIVKHIEDANIPAEAVAG